MFIFCLSLLGERKENLMQNHLGGWSYGAGFQELLEKSSKTHWTEIFR